MKKTAVVYDKWLSSLGGGEVVACNIAKILKDIGLDVLFISGKYVSKEQIYNSLKIDLTGIRFIRIWNDESALKRLVKGSDLFINTSFMDYSRGFAKRNIYYTHFPNKPYDNLKGLIFTKLVLPTISYFIKPLESMNSIDAPIILKNNPAYVLNKSNRYAISGLKSNRIQIIEFELFVENFYKELLENIKIDLENGKVLSQLIRVNHHHNILNFTLSIFPTSNTIYLNIHIKSNKHTDYDIDEDNIYLLYPLIRLKRINPSVFDNAIERVNNRLRAGIFVNPLNRLSSYQTILANSDFTKRWIKNYWNRDADLLFPPVSLLSQKYNVKLNKKNNWICSVGRFFTLGHGKKQEILIEAFKKLNDKTNKKWELHLVGGLGNEYSSVEFLKHLKEISAGYPIHFHINASRKEVEDIYLKSKIYWHATGFGENEENMPIKFEHFGISPIEAVSAGCIPILFRGGGLKEIINIMNLDKDKNLFSTIDELVQNTIYFQDPQNDELDWSSIFRILDNNFSVSAFRNKFLEILEHNGVDTGKPIEDTRNKGLKQNSKKLVKIST